MAGKRNKQKVFKPKSYSNHHNLIKIKGGDKMSNSNDEGKVFAIIAYILGIIGFLIVLLAKKDNKFAMYHAKQALVLCVAAIIGYVALMIVTMILVFIPVIGPLLSSLLYLALAVAWIYLVILGIINSVNLREKPLPYIGQYAEKINI